MFDLSHSVSPRARTSRPPSAPAAKSDLAITAYAEVDGMGMGRLSDGSAYLTQRGLAFLCGVQNAHIGTISRDWHSDKPRILAIKARLARFGYDRESPHRVLSFNGRRQYSYDMAVVQAVLDYYARDAARPQAEARTNRERFRGDALEAHILSCLEPAAVPAEPLRFTPLRRAEPDAYEAMDAVIIYICGLYALSLWLANSYLEGLKQRALNAPWNRLGLYLPLKAILEIQAEAILRMNTGLRAR